jgi:MoxR-like ATPase
MGASPRAGQTLVLAAKVHALREGRSAVESDDIARVILPAMRHRCILNFEAEAEGITTDMVLQNIVDTVPTEAAMV